MGYLETTVHDLHAFIDGQLAGERRHAVAAYLAGHPDAADRVAAYARQRDALGLLARCLAETPMPARLAELEAALLDATRQPAIIGGSGRLARAAATA